MSIEKKSNGQYQARWRDPTASSGRSTSTASRRRPVPGDGHGRPVAGPLRRPERRQLTVEAFARQWAAGQPWRESTRESRESIIEHQIVPTFGRRRAAGRASVGRSGVGRSAVGVRPGGVECRGRTSGCSRR